MFLKPDQPSGDPSFGLQEDEVATVIDLACLGAMDARVHVTEGMLEVPITRLVRKGIRRAKQSLNLTNVQLLAGEYELDEMSVDDPSILGRIDLALQFLHQFGKDDGYVAIECKRVGRGLSQLNERYVNEGVHRFAIGQYSDGHTWGFMLGYVMALPVGGVVAGIDARIQKTYGATSKLVALAPHPAGLALLVGPIPRNGGTVIHLQHVFVDMTPAS